MTKIKGFGGTADMMEVKSWTITTDGWDYWITEQGFLKTSFSVEFPYPQSADLLYNGVVFHIDAYNGRKFRVVDTIIRAIRTTGDYGWLRWRRWFGREPKCVSLIYSVTGKVEEIV